MRFLFVFIIFAITIAIANAITCYECDSLHDPNCYQYFEPEGVQQTVCDDAEMPKYLQKYERRLPATGCMTKVHEGVDGYRFFIRRSCYFGDVENTDEACKAEDEYVFYAGLINCHVCTEDLCNTNAAEKFGFSKVIFIAGFLLSLNMLRI